MTDLITGGAGFIGFHLARKLLASGRAVHSLDNLSSGRAGNLRDLEVEFPERFSFTEGSVCDPEPVAAAMEGVDRIFHLAAAVGVRRVHEDPLGTIEANVRGTEVVLEEAGRRGIPLFLASSSEVYGRSPRAVFHESDDLVIGSPHVGRWSYAASKVLGEFLALAYHRERGLPIVIGRFFNTVGPRQTADSGMVLPQFVSRALAGETLQIYGDGRQSRCFAHVEDVVPDIVGLMDDDRAAGEVYNLGGDQPVLVRDLAALVVELTGSDSEIVREPITDVFDDTFEDIHRRRPDLGRVRSLLGPARHRSLAEIVGDVAEWMHAEVGETRRV